MNMQIFSKANPVPGDQPTMQGFAWNYTHQSAPPPGVFSARDIMHYYDSEQLPVMHRLARQFAVSDRWFASAPCQTWPNRFFLHAGTANGYHNNTAAFYDMPTVFNRLSDLQQEWKIYYHDFPQALTLARLWPHLGRFRFIDEFLSDASAGTLPAYSFIEPRYFPDVHLPNDQHPPHIVTLGEQLIATVYNALRSNEEQWKQTLLIITYDEHGGLFDHASPPAAQPPSKIATPVFNFDRYGVRVPALLISPYIRQNTVLRPPDGGYPFDHTSVISTLRRRYGGPPLTLRDEVAPDLSGVFNLATPDNLGPEKIDVPVYDAKPAEVAAARARPPNDMQRALYQVAALLPNSGDKTQQSFTAFVASHVQALSAPGAAPVAAPPPLPSVDDAGHFAKKELNDFLLSLSPS